MYIGLKELARHDLRFWEEFLPGMLDFHGSEFQQVGPLRVEVSVRLEGDEIQFSGHMRGRVALPCARCLEPVEHEVERALDLCYRPIGGAEEDTEVRLADDDLAIGFYRGDGLFLADMLGEQINLAVPVKLVCREECKGLCSVCGVNRNQDSCRCQSRAQDPRWSALADWRAGKAGKKTGKRKL